MCTHQASASEADKLIGTAARPFSPFEVPPLLMCTHHQASASEADKLIGTAARPFSPFEVVGDVNGDGLGLLSWWSPAAEEE